MRGIYIGENGLSSILLPSPAPAASPAGILPIPDYSATFWSNAYLTGDWGGARTDLANKGVQVGVEWTQFVQGVASGGNDRTTEYGANLNYTINLDLMRMGVLPGALIKFRAESRYGDSVNADAGPILPVNTQALFPLNSTLDKDIGLTITDLAWVQFLSPNVGTVLGKVDTLDGDPNEFASGRGVTQFMNANMIFNPALSLRLPYSTLATSVIWMPVPPSAKGGITLTNTVCNTADSSLSSGFDDFDEGTTWTGELDLRYALGNLPGGMNLGGLYSFNQDFAHLNTRLVFRPGEGLSIPKQNSTWAVYWSAFQYLYVDDSGPVLIEMSGAAKHQGFGLFARVGFADEETNPIDISVSGGIGGRGLIPVRPNDTYGLGYYYNRNQTLRLLLSGSRRIQPGFRVLLQHRHHSRSSPDSRLASGGLGAAECRYRHRAGIKSQS
jgi:porin